VDGLAGDTEELGKLLLCSVSGEVQIGYGLPVVVGKVPVAGGGTDQSRARILTLRRPPLPGMLLPMGRLQCGADMEGVDTQRVGAGVVQTDGAGNRANQRFVDRPVSCGRALRSGDLAVATPVRRSLPYPAAAEFIDGEAAQVRREVLELPCGRYKTIKRCGALRVTLNSVRTFHKSLRASPPL